MALGADVLMPRASACIPVYVAAAGARLAGVLRIHIDHSHALGRSLVFDLLLYAVVRPGHHQVPVPAPHRLGRAPDAGEVLHYDDGTWLQVG